MFGYAWLVYFATAAVLHFSGRANRWIVAAVACIGAEQLLVEMVVNGLVGYEAAVAFDQFKLVLPVAAVVLLFFGLQALPASRPLEASPQASGGEDLRSLFTPRNDTNSFSRADRLRDLACDQLAARARADGWKIVVQRSRPYSPGVWFRIDYQLPSPRADLSLTAAVAVSVERLDFHHYDHTFTVKAQVGKRTQVIRDVIALDEAAVARIHHFIGHPARRLRLANRVRRWPWELWRPRNRVSRVGTDWPAVGAWAGAVVLLAVPVIGLLLAAMPAIWLYLRKRSRQTFVLASGKPLKDPRALHWMDSWQATVAALGPMGGAVRQGIIQRLGSNAPDDCVVETERIGYWGTDQWVEREQIVVTHRRAVGFVYVEPYGPTLYVGWESHLNAASWVEKTLATGVDRDSGLPVVANGVVAGWHRLNEYDVSDANFLAEWLHEAVKRELKLRMAEQKIDQDIDFTVQRESRKEVLERSPGTDGHRKERSTGRFQRIA